MSTAGVQIQLTGIEMEMATLAGCNRHYESVFNKRRDAHGLQADRSGLGLHVEGACGEMAVAKWRGIYWGGDANTFKAADLGRKVQIRTRSRHDYDLIVRADDPDDHAFILVTGQAPILSLRGWIYGHEAKQARFLAEHGGRERAYFVPAAELRPMLIAKARVE